MNDMTPVIIPKSDQLSADSLIAGPMTITITGVDIRPGTEQPVSISYVEDNGQPWKPCKSMSRVLVSAWGPDAKAYVGRSVTLYRDPKVKWGGMEVGGIRVSHLTHIDADMVLALTATKGKRNLFTVKPLKADRQAPAGRRIEGAKSDLTLTDRAEAFIKRVEAATTPAKMTALWAASESLRNDLDAAEPELLAEITQAYEGRRDLIEAGGEVPA